MKIKRIPLFCKNCKHVEIFNLGQYAKFIGRKWDLIWQNMIPADKARAVTAKLPPPYNLVVNLKKLESMLKEKGSIESYCMKCVASATDEWYKKRGYDSVRYGNIVTDINYYEQHQKEISLLIAEMKTK